MTCCKGILINKRKTKNLLSQKVPIPHGNQGYRDAVYFGYHRNKLSVYFLSKDDELLEVNVNITGLNTGCLFNLCTCILTIGFESDKRSLSESRNP